jgi:hypothetical protein
MERKSDEEGKKEATEKRLIVDIGGDIKPQGPHTNLGENHSHSL